MGHSYVTELRQTVITVSKGTRFLEDRENTDTWAEHRYSQNFTQISMLILLNYRCCWSYQAYESCYAAFWSGMLTSVNFHSRKTHFKLVLSHPYHSQHMLISPIFQYNISFILLKIMGFVRAETANILRLSRYSCSTKYKNITRQKESELGSHLNTCTFSRSSLLPSPH